MTRVVYAGIPIEVHHNVLIVDTEPRRPVYHHCKPGVQKKLLTSCGKESVWELGAIIPFKHARRFTRPCLRCWPALRGQAELTIKEAPL